MAAIAYHRDQAGAPALTYSTNTSTTPWANLKLILKACLVTGFGSQAAAGWELINEGTNFLVLRNGSHTGYVCFTNSGIANGIVDIYVASTYTGMSGNVMTGDGLKSGLAAGVTVPQRFNIAYLSYGTLSTSWAMVADNKTFILNIYTGATTSTPSEITTGGNSFNLLFYCGEDSNGWFVTVGGENIAGSGAQNWFSSTGSTTLRNPATGLLVGTDAIALSTTGLGDQAQSFSINAVMPSLDFCKCPWIAGGVFAGHFRGLVYAGALTRHWTSYAAYCLGVASFNQRNGSTPINFGDSYTWFLNLKTTSSANTLMTTNPDYW